MSIEELVGRLEKLTGPDSGVDHELWAWDRDSVKRTDWEWLALCGRRGGKIPAYTASLDSALTLLEPGCEYSISTLHCIANIEVGLNCGDELEPQSSRRLDCNVILAMCEAALKFRAHVNERASEKERA